MIFRLVRHDCIVSDAPIDGSLSPTPEQRETYYGGGWLVAESCAKGALPLLLAAPEMLALLQDVVDPANGAPPELAQRAAELVARARPSDAMTVYAPMVDEVAEAMFGAHFTNADEARKARLRQCAYLVDLFAARSEEDQLRAFLPPEYATLSFRELRMLLETHGRWQARRAPKGEAE